MKIRIPVTLNIIQEALTYLANFFHHKKPYRFKRISKDTCRLLFVVSLNMASSLQELKQKVTTGAPSIDLERHMTAAALLVDSDTTRMQQLGHVLSMSRKEFNKRNDSRPPRMAAVSDEAMQHDNGEESADEFDQVVINL